MNILDSLDKLRAKPVHVRKQIAFGSTAVISLIIVSIWWSAWNADGLTTSTFSSGATRARPPLALLFEMVGRAKDDTVVAFKDLTNQLGYAAGGNAGTPSNEETNSTSASNAFRQDATGETLRTRPRSLGAEQDNNTP